MKTEEQVQSYTSNFEPATGDKRQRDEDHTAIPHPASRTNGAKGEAKNEDFMPAGQMGGDVQAMPGYDALYIGDLQWVRSLVAYSHVLLVPKNCVFLACIHLVDNRRRSTSSCFELRCKRRPQRYHLLRA
jgi:hypothetical protein